jgi:Domain of unknown function (DUF4389)
VEEHSARLDEEDVHPVRLHVRDDLMRNRVTVLFRIILLIPHLIWVTAWSIIAVFAAIGGWFATLFTGTLPQGLHDFLAAYTRYVTHVFAYGSILAEPFPGFLGESGYPVDAEIDPPVRQNRWTVAFRIILAIPVLIVQRVLEYLLGVVALINWVTGLVTGRVLPGVERLGNFVLRFRAQTTGYVLLLTQRYPDFSPK